jgi:hypothetical protein
MLIDFAIHTATPQLTKPHGWTIAGLDFQIQPGELLPD